MHILLHGITADIYAAALQASGHTVATADEVDDLDLWLKDADLDAIVLDPQAEGGRAVAWARRQRARNADLTIAFAFLGIVDVIDLYRDADDVARLPIDAGEFEARLQAVIRRRRGYASALLQVGDLTLDQHTREARYGSKPLRISSSTSRMLELLMLRRGRVVTKAMFLDHLYGGRDEPESKIVDVFLCKIRSSLRDVGAPADFIKTVWGRGYTIDAANPSDAAVQTQASAA